MSLHHVLDRIRCDDVTEIGGCALYSVVAPEYVLPRHEQYQIRDLLRDAGSSRILPGMGHGTRRLSSIMFDNNIIRSVGGEGGIIRDCVALPCGAVVA